ncbi:MAG: hypothetical protein LZF60_120001, partial [Nitrospira sp.]
MIYMVKVGRIRYVTAPRKLQV